MIPITYNINYKYGEVIKIKPLFDVHWGNTQCDRPALKTYLADSDELTFFFGGGDLFDSIVTPDKRYSKDTDDTETDTIIDEQVETLYDVLLPYREKFIGLGIGNHERTVMKKCGTNPVARMCSMLDITYLGYSGFIRLKMSENGSRGRTVVIRWHHGWGGGRTPGASINRYSRELMSYEADCYFYGHDHQRKSDRIPRMGFVGKEIVSKPQVIGVCGSYLKTFSLDNTVPYSEAAGYAPVEISGITLNIKPDRKWVKMWINL